MKKEFLILYLILVNTSLFGSNYYVSNSGSDSNDGTSQSEAWETLDKVNASMASFNPGDSILFKRGDVFIGTLTITTSGNSTNPVVFGAYDSGAKPIIKASKQISNWTQNGNVWTADCPDCPETVTNLFIDEVFQPLGRYPNNNYLTISSGTGKNILVDQALNFPNGYWNNSDIAIKTATWVLDVVPVSSQVGTTLNLAENTTYNISQGWGYFFQNHLQTLDFEGEWAFDNNQKKIHVYYNSNLNDNKVEIAFYDNCILLENQNYINIQNLELTGSLTTTLKIRSCNYITFSENNISYSGGNGIEVSSSPNSIFENNVLSNTNNNAFDSDKSNNSRFSDNIITNTSTIAGRGYSGNSQSVAIRVRSCDNNTIEFNKLDSTGYNGIVFYYTNNILVKNNFVNHSCIVKADGAGIYSWNTDGTNNRIIGNIVLNSIVNSNGDEHAAGAEGIYLDDGCKNMVVEDNTTAFCFYGIYIHNCSSIKITNNTAYKNTQSQLHLVHGGTGWPEIENCIISYNSFFATGEHRQWAMSMRYILTNQFENNKLCDPFKQEIISDVKNNKEELYSVEEWQNLGYVTEKPIPLTFAQSGLPDTTGFILFDYNPGKITKTISLYGSYRDLNNNLVSGSVEIEPYSSIILLKEYRSILGSETTPSGQMEFCQGTQNTSYSTTGTPEANSYTWQISPVSAGVLNGNDLNISIDWNPLYSGTANISYQASGPNSFKALSPPLQVNILPKPHQPEIPNGPSSLFQNAPQSDYTTIEIEDATSYEWNMNPPEAGRLFPFGNTCGVEWNEPFFGTAYVSVRAENGCGLGLFSDSLRIQVQEAELAYGIINIFTPNGDGFNDYWSIPFIRDFPDATIKIFDRSNRLLIEYNGLESSWNGTVNGELVPMGSYLYVIDLKTGKPPIKGYVTVLK